MKITKESYVTMDYVLNLKSGETVDQSDPETPLEFVTGYNQIIPGLEKELMGKEAKESFQVVVEPEEAYGPHQTELIQNIPLKQFPEGVELEVGMSFQATSPQGMPINFVVKEIEPEAAVIDLNHPLAGKTLIFDVVIKGVRAATEEELHALKQPAACNPGDQSGCGGGCSCG